MATFPILAHSSNQKCHFVRPPQNAPEKPIPPYRHHTFAKRQPPPDEQSHLLTIQLHDTEYNEDTLK